ncbi:MAG: hypothetical protein OWT27_04685 [Firmicutes bacterium]|nr:hypothetical protein [Bacillota bacterium]
MADAKLRFQFDDRGHPREFPDGADTCAGATITAASQSGHCDLSPGALRMSHRRIHRHWRMSGSAHWVERRVSEIRGVLFVASTIGLVACAALLAVLRIAFGITPGVTAVTPALPPIASAPLTAGGVVAAQASHLRSKASLVATAVEPLSLLVYSAGSYNTLAQARVAQAQYRAAAVQTAIFPGEVYQLVLAPVFVSARVNTQLMRSFAQRQVPYYVVTVHVPAPNGLAARGWLATDEPGAVRRAIDTALCASGRVIDCLVAAPNEPYRGPTEQGLRKAALLDAMAVRVLRTGFRSPGAADDLRQALQRMEKAFGELGAGMAASGLQSPDPRRTVTLATRIAAAVADDAAALGVAQK